ncbi:MAG: TlpA family protein disulfide reductase [Cyclobacteriaceae bacterium]|nr:TlpA family protein disulfide reductase [Cyclobacteriaceae bacterium]
MKKKKTLRRELIEWSAIIGIFALLFFTGLHTTVIGSIQRIVLFTGILQPNTQPESSTPASYAMILQNTDGEFINMEDFKNKVVFMNIWATWCPPCIAEMPDIQALYDRLKTDNIPVEFIMLSVDEDPEKAFAFARKRQYTFPVYSSTGKLPDVYKSPAIPTTFVISPQGNIVARREGMAKYNTKKFRQFLKDLQ